MLSKTQGSCACSPNNIDKFVISLSTDSRLGFDGLAPFTSTIDEDNISNQNHEMKKNDQEN